MIYFFKVILRNIQLNGIEENDIHSIFSNSKYGKDIKILKILKDTSKNFIIWFDKQEGTFQKT
jgi:hypothetical protein